jgi:hypothetical protein
MHIFKNKNFFLYYSLLLTVLILVMGIILARLAYKFRQKEITVERINIVDGDGKTRMIISNKKMMPIARMNGRILEDNNKRNAGLLFYNEDGEECGGYLYGGGDSSSPFSHFTFDQHKQDQVLVLKKSEYIDEGQRYVTAGLLVKGQPTKLTLDKIDQVLDSINLITNKLEKKKRLEEFNAKLDYNNALYVGKLENNDYGLFLTDKNNTERMNLFIDNRGNAKLEFKDSLGRVILSLPK